MKKRKMDPASTRAEMAGRVNPSSAMHRGRGKNFRTYMQCSSTDLYRGFSSVGRAFA